MESFLKSVKKDVKRTDYLNKTTKLVVLRQYIGHIDVKRTLLYDTKVSFFIKETM